MRTYEVEAKALLGSAENTERVYAQLCARDPALRLLGESTQVNHYFIGRSPRAFAEALAPALVPEVRERLREIAEGATDASLRTRADETGASVVAKIAVGDGDSVHGVSRIEFHEPALLPIEELDRLLLAAGFSYQSKWSRKRKEYAYAGMTVCLDFTPGYGFVAEFERVVDDASAVPEARASVLGALADLGLAEVSQELLAKMFAHYNAHWEEYYGTERTFSVDDL